VIPSPKGASATVAYIPIELLRRSLQRFRSPVAQRCTGESLRELPIRIVAAGDGAFEVVDGFKYLARWREAEHSRMQHVS
jgi:hypothetical protein